MWAVFHFVLLLIAITLWVLVLAITIPVVAISYDIMKNRDYESVWRNKKSHKSAKPPPKNRKDRADGDDRFVYLDRDVSLENLLFDAEEKGEK